MVSMTTLLLRGVRERANTMFLVCQGMVALWCGSRVLILLSTTTWQLAVGNLIGNFGICFVGAFWLYFTILYSSARVSEWVARIPIIGGCICYILIVTSSWHNLYYQAFTYEKIVHGPLFYVNVCCTYLWVTLGVVLLYRGMGQKRVEVVAAKKSRNIGRAFIVLAVAIPVLFNVLYLTGVVKSDFDITPLGFAASVILVMFGTVKYQFIDSRRALEIANEKLMLANERNRIAQQVHDTAGHTLTMIQSYMKLVDVSLKKEEIEIASSYISEARELTSKGIKELRESINQLRAEESSELITQGIMVLTNQVKELEMEVTVQGEDGEKYSHLSKVVYGTVRETITNTLKYANASRMEVIVRFQEKQLELMLSDDGEGCESIIDNNGMRGMKERVEKAGGTIRFVSSKGEGFLTIMKLPL